EVDARICEIELLGVALPEIELGVGQPRRRHAIRQQVDAGQPRRRRAQRQQPRELAPRPASNLEHASLAKRHAAGTVEKVLDHAPALRQHHLVAPVAQVIARTGGRFELAIRAGDPLGFRHASAPTPMRESTSMGMSKLLPSRLHSQVAWECEAPFLVSVRPQSHAKPRSRAGLPATMPRSGTSRVTTAPAPTSAMRPTLIPGRITAPPPTAAP